MKHDSKKGMVLGIILTFALMVGCLALAAYLGIENVYSWELSSWLLYGG